MKQACPDMFNPPNLFIKTTMSRILTPVKIICLMISVLSIESIPNGIKNPTSLRAIEIREFLYFTNIGLLFTVFTVVAGLLPRKNKLIVSIYKFSVPVCFILEILITLIFWPLFLKDPFLVKHRSDFAPGARPRILDELPKHGFPALILLIEQLSINIEKCWRDRAFLFLFGMCYFMMSEVFTQIQRIYLYPFLGTISRFQRFMLFAFISAIGILLYELIFSLKYLLKATTTMQKKSLKKKPSMRKSMSKLPRARM